MEGRSATVGAGCLACSVLLSYLVKIHSRAQLMAPTRALHILYMFSEMVVFVRVRWCLFGVSVELTHAATIEPARGSSGP